MRNETIAEKTLIITQIPINTVSLDVEHENRRPHFHKNKSVKIYSQCSACYTLSKQNYRAYSVMAK